MFLKRLFKKENTMTRQIYTIGYTGRKPEEIKAIADRLGAYLFDIRFSPRSRNPQWSQANLKNVFGQRYVHLAEWGNANYKGEYGDAGPVIVNFERGKAAIDRLSAPVILMCGCKDATWCHRTYLADMLINRGYKVTELA